MMLVTQSLIQSFYTVPRRLNKPFNPLLGETFECITPKFRYFSESVSHHPPVSAFYFESVDQQMYMEASLWTKSKFLGLSIGVHMIGKGVITLLDHDEDYVVTFPSGYGRYVIVVTRVNNAAVNSIVLSHVSGLF